MQEGQDQLKAATSFRRRLFWLLACTALGLGIGIVGHHFTADTAWFLALPASLAAGWLFFANPDECARGQGCRRE